MINNEFLLIGICTTNFQYIGNGKWKSYLLKLEVEKFASKKGNAFEVEVQVYGNNNAVDTKLEMLGKQVAVNGYIDSFQTNEGHVMVKLVAQRIYPLGEQQIKISNDVDTGTGEELDQEQLPDGNVELSEDDLPF